MAQAIKKKKGLIGTIKFKIKKNQFLFEELVKRDFKKKYKGTALGMAWSMLSPLLMLLIMYIVFKNLLGKDRPSYAVYMFAGNIIYMYYNEATKGGMKALVQNSAIFSKVNVPKYLFVLSKNVATFINFLLTIVIFFVFVALDPRLHFTWKFLCLIYPVLCVLVFNVGVGMVLSALYLKFKDTQYLFDAFNRMIMYLCAIFYYTENFGAYAKLFFLNPLYLYIWYFRQIVLFNTIPNWKYHALAAFYALFMLGLGAFIYKKNNYKFLYYI